MKQGILFDMDGTLLDTERLYRETWMQLAAEYGQTPNPQMPYAVAGTSGEHMLDVIRRFYPAVDPIQFRDDCLARVQAQAEQCVEVKCGAAEILKYLHEIGIPLAVASSSAQEDIENHLGRAGLLSYFSAVVSAQAVENGKPAPDIFLLAAERLGISPANCYVIEDGRNGVLAGVAAGCDTIMVPDGNPADDELRSICVGVYEDLMQVLNSMKQGKL